MQKKKWLYRKKETWLLYNRDNIIVIILCYVYVQNRTHLLNETAKSQIMWFLLKQIIFKQKKYAVLQL